MALTGTTLGPDGRPYSADVNKRGELTIHDGPVADRLDEILRVQRAIAKLLYTLVNSMTDEELDEDVTEIVLTEEVLEPHTVAMN